MLYFCIRLAHRWHYQCKPVCNLLLNIPTLILSLHLAQVSTDVHTRRSIYTNMPCLLIHAKRCARIILINVKIYAIILNRNSVC